MLVVWTNYLTKGEYHLASITLYFKFKSVLLLKYAYHKSGNSFGVQSSASGYDFIYDTVFFVSEHHKFMISFSEIYSIKCCSYLYGIVFLENSHSRNPVREH